MYDVPDDSETKLLMGQTLELICCSATQVTFHFDGGASISTQAEFSLVNAEGDTDLIHVPMTSGAVLALVDSEILIVERRNEKRTLALVLSNRAQLEFHSGSHFESFHLKIGGREFHI